MRPAPRRGEDQGVNTRHLPRRRPRAGSGTPPPRLYRSSDGRVLAGVARGLADHLGRRRAARPAGVRRCWRRRAARASSAYGLFWVFAPQNPYEARAAARPRARPHHAARARLADRRRPAAAVGARHRPQPGLAVPLVAVGVGVSILWRQADDDAREPVAGGDRHATGCPAPPGPAAASRCSSSAAGRDPGRPGRPGRHVRRAGGRARRRRPASRW